MSHLPPTESSAARFWQRARFGIAIIVARMARMALRLVRHGGGTALPGVVANAIAPNALISTLSSFPLGLVIVSGSSGKSTTTKMIAAVVRAHGQSVFSNDSTANIRQGLMSALLDQTTLFGCPRASLAVLEMDEAHGAQLAAGLSPTTVVLTNVMTDQIDRFNDPHSVAALLAAIAGRATREVVLNADDAIVCDIGCDLDGVAVSHFGASEEVFSSVPHGFGYLRSSLTRVRTGTVVTEVKGTVATITHRGEPVTLSLPAQGMHYAMDAAAAIAAAASVLGAAFDLDRAALALSDMEPVFGRGEVVLVDGQPVQLVLVQNPASFQLNIDQLPEDARYLMVAMGSDVRDPSYLWPVDTASLQRVATVSGSLAEDLALQFAYSGVEVETVEPDLDRALDSFIAAPAPAVGMKTVIFSADAMRRTRRHWRLV